MEKMARQVAREVKAMTRREIIIKAIDGQISWVAAADIIGITPRHMRRMRRAIERGGMSAVMDQRGGRPRRKRIAVETIGQMCRLKREVYPDFSIRHFYEHLTERHAIAVSYTFTRMVLQEAGIVEKEPGRGRYRRRRERRPMVGMLIHLDGSPHQWIAGLPYQDLIVAMDDADGRILYAEFFAQEGTLSSFKALGAIIGNYGRFCELYTDRGSHFCRTAKAGEAPAEEQNGQVAQALRALGIRHIPAARRRRGGAASGPLRPSKGDCHKNCACMALPATRKPTATSRKCSCPTSTVASRSPRPNRKVPSPRWWESTSNCCCRPNTNEWCATTTPSPSKT
jgi:transposase